MLHRDPRKPITAMAVCKSSTAKQRVVVSDLSIKGCRIESPRIPLAPNHDLILEFDGLEKQFATVRWVREGNAGIEFDYPLHPAVVDHLCETNPHTVDRRIGRFSKAKIFARKLVRRA